METKIKHLRGMRAAMASYDGFRGDATVADVLSRVPEELRERLTGHELGLVMSAVNRAYHSGRASHGGLDLIDECVWLPWGGEPDVGGQLLPTKILAQIKRYGNHYTLDAEEGR